MKKIRIAAATMAIMMMTGVLATGCKKDETSASSVSDTGLSIDFDPNGTTTMATAIMVSYENNYDEAARAEMNKIVTVHGMTFNELEYNFYYANEYAQLLSTAMQYQGSVPMNGGFIDLSAEIGDGMTFRDYINDLVTSDLQGEAFLLEYAQEKNVQMDTDVVASIDEKLNDARETADAYGITLDDYLKSYYGPNATEDGMREVLQRYEMVTQAMKHYVENYEFAEGEDTLPVVYHVLFPVYDNETKQAYTEEQMDQSKQRAEEFMASVKSLDDMKTKGEKAVADGTSLEAAQYTVMPGMMVAEFEDWCFAKHEVGDKDIVVTQYGYHVMYFVGTEPATDEQKPQLAYMALQNKMDAAFASGEYDLVFAN